ERDGTDGDILRRRIRRLEQSGAERQQVGSWTGRAFGEQRDGLVPFKRLGNGQGLVFRTLAMSPLHVNGVILVGEPMNERMTKLMLGHEGTAGRATKDDDVEPAKVVRDEQGVRARPVAFQPDART